MLESLFIRDIVLIERLTLEFAPGLTVFTGETGAGKSILLDALGLALGLRDGRGLVRAGAEEGAAAASFACPPDHPARALAEAAGVAWDDDALTLRRVVSAGGRSRAFVNDQRVSADTLRAIGESLVEAHGQHDDRGLMNPRGHRAILDAFAGADAAREGVAAAWRRWREAGAALEEARAGQEAAARDRDYLEHAAKELAEFAPEPGEDEALDSRRRLMQAAERIRGEIAAALQALGPEGAEGAAADAMRRLDAAAPAAEGRLDAPLEALSRGVDALAEAAQGVEAALGALDFDPRELEEVEERLFALRALARKHRCAPDDLPGLADALAARLSAIEDGAGRIDALAKDLADAEAAYREAAAGLSALRREAAAALDAAVAAELPPLKMERARFETRIGEAEPGPEGADEVAFTIAPNPGAAPGPLRAVASGGELSRLLLALKVALAGRGGAATMIFDEIDRGVGGATADAVGRRLARLAETGQVLVVTHSPQVAARADAHFRIEKRVSGEETRTEVSPLSGAERRDEIARMLSGDRVTEAARNAAEALIG